ncbi:hypothetical protein QMO56_21535 [Roseomonas sp. E05]|uniref:hypothetical protein n=1 Tax=Roseomonas sp. E05 TaxID=3046310 RepID=UPI0024B922A5|nr:hypothetical protein [Roseomonas sp. E05]MDJ0390702.1 hypothetical protein [Roseomonas sp. E05]
MDSTTRTAPRRRAQPVRDQILAYLTEPRHAYEIAAHTGRRTATITGHMQAMLRLRLVERVAYGVYARAGTLRGPAPAEALARPHPIRSEIFRFLAEPRHIDDIAAHLGRCHDKVTPELRTMIGNGLMRCIGPQVFARAGKGTGQESSRRFVAAGW